MRSPHQPLKVCCRPTHRWSSFCWVRYYRPTYSRRWQRTDKMDPSAEIQIPISERAAYLARVHIGVTIPLLALCLVPFCARLYVRMRPVWRVGWDDGFIVLGFVR